MNKNQIPSPPPFLDHVCVCGTTRRDHMRGVGEDHTFEPVDMPRLVAYEPIELCATCGSTKRKHEEVAEACRGGYALNVPAAMLQCAGFVAAPSITVAEIKASMAAGPAELRVRPASRKGRWL